MEYEIVNFYDTQEDNKPKHQALYINGEFIVDWSGNHTEINSDIVKYAKYRNFFVRDALKDILSERPHE